MLQYNKHLKIFARHLRSNMTIAEAKLWSSLRGKQIFGISFYRQKPIGNFIVDFYAPKIQLVIELDGSQHFEKSQVQKDIARDSYLREMGLVVLRFNNLEVLHNFEGVMQTILDLAFRTNLPHSLFSKEGWCIKQRLSKKTD